MSNEFKPGEVYLRHTSPGGTTYVTEHRVWNAELLLSSQRAAVEKVNADDAKKTDSERKAAGWKTLARVEQITIDQYKAERKAAR
jgi:hypothetical protein